MKIERFIGGMLESNGYVIYQKDGGNCYVIDPGYHAEFLRNVSIVISSICQAFF